MKISDKGITVDCDIMRSAFRNDFRSAGTLDFERVFAAITVNPELDRDLPECVSIDTRGSSAFVYALYCPGTQRLVVKFTHGGMYRYENVSLQTAFDFAGSESKGTFFHERIRVKHVATRVG